MAFFLSFMLPDMSFRKLYLHPDFKSPCHEIDNIDELVNCFKCDDLCNMTYVSGFEFYDKNDDFLKKLHSYTFDTWNDLHVTDFKIDYTKIDRFYTYDHGFGDLACTQTDFRMDNQGQSIYVQAKVNYERPEVELYLTLDPDLFLKDVIEWQDDTLKVWQSMVDDGIAVQKPVPPPHLAEAFEKEIKKEIKQEV